MARKKKVIEPIIGTGWDPENKLTVQKSRPLFSLWRSDMTLAEFKILDTYLARIDSHQPDKRTVIFTKGELEQLLGVKKINKSVLSQRLANLYRGVEIEKVNSKKLHTVALFEEAYGEMDENGLWTIKLTCSAPAMKYIFNVEELRYLRYKLRSITSLNSRYTYVLFLYLERNRFRKTWEEDVDTLRHYLNCDSDESYSAFKVFNDRILKRCQKEIQEKTECRFTYEPIKKGRKVVAVKFTLETIADILPEANDELDGQQQLPEFGPGYETMTMMRSACEDEFTVEQMKVILSILATKEFPPDPNGFEWGPKFHYLQQKYNLLQIRAQGEVIWHRFEYFVKMLENDN